MRNQISPLLLLSFLAQSHAFSPKFTGSKSLGWTRTPAIDRSNFVPAKAKAVTKSSSFYQNPYDRRRVVVTAGWGPDPVWEKCTVLSSSKASKECVNIVVQVTAKQGEEYAIPGQYCQVKIHGDDEAKPLFLAIASPPSSSTSSEEEKKDEGGDACEFEFLVKRTENNGWLCDATEGTNIDVSQILGGGFPMKENLDGLKYDFPTQNVLLVATGTGIAPIRAAIESGQLAIGNGGRSARLYYGIRTPKDMPYVDRFMAWEKAGVEVVPVVSQPEGTDWEGRSGYVQNALEEDGIPIPRNSGALLCGQKGMVDAVKDLLTQSGVFEGRMLTNF